MSLEKLYKTKRGSKGKAEQIRYILNVERVGASLVWDGRELRREGAERKGPCHPRFRTSSREYLRALHNWT